LRPAGLTAMRALIAAAMDRSRTTLLLFLFLLLGGMAAYQAIPKESNPDVTIPMIYVSMTLEGISPEDGERLLVRPMEQELRSLEGIKEMRDRKSTRLNSSHVKISYAVFCLKKKKTRDTQTTYTRA